MRFPTVAIIVPCRNNADSLEAVLRSLLLQASPAEEIICVDDGSEASQYSRISLLCGKYGATLLLLPEPTSDLGRRSAARTLGSKAAKADVLLYLDGDMVLGPEYISALRVVHGADSKALLKGQRLAIPMSEQRYGINHILDIASAPPTGTPHMMATLQTASEPKALLLRNGKLPDSLRSSTHLLPGSIQYSNRWDYCASNNLSVRRAEVEKIAYWDEGFIGWGEEDIDFAWRLFRSGCRPILAFGYPLLSYHLDHKIDDEEIRKSLFANAIHFVKKFPVMSDYRRSAYELHGLDHPKIVEAAFRNSNSRLPNRHSDRLRF